MNFTELIKDRYSVRKYKDQPIPEDILDSIIEAGIYAPTACNNQPQKIYIAKTKESIDKLKECTPFTFDAPLVMVIGYDKTRSWYNKRMPGYESGETDSAIVTTHMMLAAHNIGVGSCWVMHFDPAAMRENFNIPENYEPIALLVMGYPAPDAAPIAMHSTFRPMEETVAYETF